MFVSSLSCERMGEGDVRGRWCLLFEACFCVAVASVLETYVSCRRLTPTLSSLCFSGLLG